MIDTVYYWIASGPSPQIWVPWLLVSFSFIITYTLIRMFKG
ncbi:MAG: hypothetical protein AAGF54_03615 [Pseudomonadota bacterium]